MRKAGVFVTESVSGATGHDCSSFHGYCTPSISSMYRSLLAAKRHTSGLVAGPRRSIFTLKQSQVGKAHIRSKRCCYTLRDLKPVLCHCDCIGRGEKWSGTPFLEFSSNTIELFFAFRRDLLDLPRW